MSLRSPYVPTGELFDMVDRLRERFPGIDFGEVTVRQVGVGTVEVISDLATIKIEGLELLEERLKELFLEQQEIEEKHDEVLSRESKVRKLQTSLSVATFTIMGIGGLVTGGVLGAALLVGALLNGAHTVAREMGVYGEVSKSLAKTEEKQMEMEKALENGVGFLCLASGVASVFLGGSDTFSDGFQQATETGLRATSAIGTAAQGLAGMKGARLTQRRLEFEVDFLGVTLTLNLRRTVREDTEDMVFDALRRMNEKVEDGGNGAKNMFELSAQIARNMAG